MIWRNWSEVALVSTFRTLTNIDKFHVYSSVYECALEQFLYAALSPQTSLYN